jgi:hypothetical protein
MRMTLKIKLLVILVLFPFFLNAQINRDKKIEHIVAGYLIGGTGNFLVYKLTDNKTVGLISGVALSLLAGHIKEKLDEKNGKYYSTNDLMYTSFGGLGGSITVRVIIGKKERKRNIPNEEM